MGHPQKLGQIPGVSYGISGWSITKLRQWLTQNMAQILPKSLQVNDVQAGTVTVSTKLSLSSSALADLKKQLGL